MVSWIKKLERFERNQEDCIHNCKINVKLTIITVQFSFLGNDLNLNIDNTLFYFLFSIAKNISNHKTLPVLFYL